MTTPPAPADPFSLGPTRPADATKSIYQGGHVRGALSGTRWSRTGLWSSTGGIAAGGVALTTVAYCAVSPEGSTDGSTLLLRQEAVPGLTRLADAVHAEGALVSAQIGHAGVVANPAATGLPSIGPTSNPEPSGDATVARGQ